MLSENDVNAEISTLKTYWSTRNLKFQEWYEFLTMIDLLATKGMESYVSNEPATFYQMAHYLLTKGEMSHFIPVQAESLIDLDNRAKVHRACQYMWRQIDRERRLGGSQPFVDDMSFYLLTLGWFSIAMMFDSDTSLLKAQIWNPYDVYPKYVNDSMEECVHVYPITETEAKFKAKKNGWEYGGRTYNGNMYSDCILSDFFIKQDGVWHNMILIDGKDVTGWVARPEMQLLVAPLGGYPDKGSLSNSHAKSGGNTSDWKSYTGKGIFEVNKGVTTSFNKWKTMVAQILRDTAQPLTNEFSATPQATPEQIRERGGLFHYAPGEQGLQRVPPPQMPPDIQNTLGELRREMQKGSFNDAVYGMIEGEPGYALSMLASSSANQILYPYMDGKHFVIGEADQFWLQNIKNNGKVFTVRSKFIEKIEPKNLPDEVTVIVESDVATPKDWLERGTIGGMVREDIDKATLLTEIYKLPDAQGIIRRKSLDRTLDHPMTIQIELISGYRAHANYLQSRGDRQQADLFRKAADTLEAQMGQPEPGQASTPTQQAGIVRARQEGAPAQQPVVPSNVASPEAVGGFTPEQLRRSIGRGTVRVR